MSIKEISKRELEARERISALSDKEIDDLRDELCDLVFANDFEKTVNFLKDYPIKQSFYELLCEEEGIKTPLFFCDNTLANAAAGSIEQGKDTKLLDYLIDICGINPNFKFEHTKDNYNALTFYMDQIGLDEKVIKYFIQKGATFNVFNHLGDSILHDWAIRGEIDEIKLALKYGANLEIQSQIYQKFNEKSKEYEEEFYFAGSTPLMSIVESNDEQNYNTIKVLLELGANPNHVRWPRLTSIIEVCQISKVKKILLEFGAKSQKKMENEIFKFQDEYIKNKGIKEEDLTREDMMNIARIINDKFIKEIKNKS
ncbi:hypothetical protein JG676_03290 [Campylobacter sp. 2018MI35]|uniref:ankyrin repeat domain-containing protein n=1 Tax=unclassified Campylobacter TaxID=2593542 RepID=UPI00190333A1|nr:MULTISPECIES: ankyrin repeat domain-containing protein [unclassified Campylobacter]MBK1971116.1 hypothetical protein [Campylobacter sp. TTU_617]MBK1991625.1 hypothetical protein [Campylobacter sp. 2018MI34]